MMNESNFPEEFELKEETENTGEFPTAEFPTEELLTDEFSAEELLTEEFPAVEFPTEENLAEELPLDALFMDEFPAEPAPEELPLDVFPEFSSIGEEFPAAELTDAEELPEAAVEDAQPVLEDPAQDALSDPQLGDELMAADHAMYSAGLQHPEDREFLFDEDIPLDVEAEAGEETPQEEPQPESRKERPVRKGRPKRKKGPALFGIPHLLAALVWLLIILAIGTTLGRLLWVCAADVLAFGREDKDVTISVTSEDTMDSIAQKLKDAGLVRYPELFLLYADLTDAQEDITTGTFTLNTVYDYHALVSQMSPRSGNRVVVEDVLIPEGYNCRQIFALLEEKGVCKAADLEKWAAEGELSEYWFLEGVQRGDKYCLEGFLFPDTYDFYENSTPRAALEKMLDGFEYRINEEIRAKLPALNERLSTMMRDNGDSEEFIAANQFDIRDVVNVASLIEKETASNQESYRIASVIYNRLFSWGSNPRYLNIDATVIYALGGKTDLTAEDMAVDSPYNTYVYTGMTPGPIANPGLASIEAALDPESSSYYYYVLNPETGVHQFSKTLAEHEKYVSKFYGD